MPLEPLRNPAFVEYAYPSNPHDEGRVRVVVGRGNHGLNVSLPDLPGSWDKTSLWVDTFPTAAGDPLQFLFFDPDHDEPVCRMRVDTRTGKVTARIDSRLMHSRMVRLPGGQFTGEVEYYAIPPLFPEERDEVYYEEDA